MKTYQKVLIGVGTATVVTGATILAIKYQEVKKQEEKEAASARAKIAAKSEEVKNKIKGVECSRECPVKVFCRRICKVFGIE